MRRSFDAAMRPTDPPSLWPTSQAIAIDILAITDVPDDGTQILGVVRKGCRLGTAATLPNATLVESQHQETAVGQGAGQLAEHRNACHCHVAIGLSCSADEHDRRQSHSSRSRRFRHGPGQDEPIGRHRDRLVTRARRPRLVSRPLMSSRAT
jgi:hypothetical protein